MQLSTLTRMPQLLESLPRMVSPVNQISLIPKIKLAVYTKRTHNNKSVGVVLAAEKKEASKLFVPTRESGKLYKMDDHIIMSVSGVVADANFLIDYGRL